MTLVVSVLEVSVGGQVGVGGGCVGVSVGGRAGVGGCCVGACVGRVGSCACGWPVWLSVGRLFWRLVLVCRWWSLVQLDRCVLCWVTLGVRFGGTFLFLLFTFLAVLVAVSVGWWFLLLPKPPGAAEETARFC